MSLPDRVEEPDHDPSDEAVFAIVRRRMAARSAQEQAVRRYLRVRFPEDDQ